jgi:Bacterial Ig domain
MTDARSRTPEEYLRSTGGRRWGRGRILLVGVIGALVLLAVGLIFSAYAAGQGADPVEGESFSKPSGTEVVTGNQYSGGKALKITSGKALPTKRVTITETSNVLVRARAGQSGGSPTLTIRVDGENAGTRRITSSVLSDYLYSGITLEPGTYKIGLKGGDLAQGRYVFVDVVRFPAVSSPNEPPVGVEDSATVSEDSGATTIDVLANDTDADGDPLTIASVSNPAHGTAVVESGKVNYTPNANYNGPDSFSYTVSDGNGGTDTATVSITVNSVNDAPVAEDDQATTDEDKALTIDVLANDTEVDGDTLTIVDGSLSNPAHGTAVVESGKVNYTPAGNYNGPDEFTYTVSDGNGGTDTATVSITVNSVDDAPVAEDDSATTP